MRGTQVPSAWRVSTCVLIYAMVFTGFFIFILFYLFIFLCASIQYMLQEISSNMYSYLFKAVTEQWSVAIPPFLHV